MPTTNLQDSQSDRAVLSRPSLVLVTWLLDSSLDNVTKVMITYHLVLYNQLRGWGGLRDIGLYC